MLCAYSIRRKAKKVLKLVLSRLIVEHHENFIWSFISIQDRMQWAKKPSHATVPFRDNKARLKLLRFFIFTGEIESCNLLFWRENSVFDYCKKIRKKHLREKIGGYTNRMLNILFLYPTFSYVSTCTLWLLLFYFSNLFSFEKTFSPSISLSSDYFFLVYSWIRGLTSSAPSTRRQP
jgi:hypothetical protein